MHSVRPSARSGFALCDARAPIRYPSDNARRTTPMTFVHTAVLAPNQGARTRTAASSTVIVAVPARSAIRRTRTVRARTRSLLLAGFGRRGLGLRRQVEPLAAHVHTPRIAARVVDEVERAREVALVRTRHFLAVRDQLDGAIEVDELVVEVH